MAGWTFRCYRLLPCTKWGPAAHVYLFFFGWRTNTMTQSPRQIEGRDLGHSREPNDHERLREGSRHSGKSGHAEQYKSYLSPLELQKITGDSSTSRENEVKAIRSVYVMWLRMGSLTAAAHRLQLTPRKVRDIVYYGKRKGIIKHQWRPRREYPRKETIKKITRIRDLYEEHGTLQSVADHIGCTKQRVHQILAQGKRHGLFDEMPSSWKCKSRIASNVAVRQSSEQKMGS